MKESDKRLTDLLKQVETDKPHSEFTSDIMQMISSAVMEDSISNNITDLKIEKAPMHMTDYVMDDIISNTQNSYSLINSSEIKRAAIIMFIGLSFSLLLWLNSNVQLELSLDKTMDNNLFNLFMILVSGTVLWTLDRWTRNRYFSYK